MSESSAKEKRVSVASYAGSDVSQSHGKPVMTSRASSEHRPKFEVGEAEQPAQVSLIHQLKRMLCYATPFTVILHRQVG